MEQLLRGLFYKIIKNNSNKKYIFNKIKDLYFTKFCRKMGSKKRTIINAHFLTFRNKSLDKISSKNRQKYFPFLSNIIENRLLKIMVL